MQEPGESEKLNIGLMKELTGGDRILVRGLYKEPVEFRPQFKMVMTCNELPEVPSDDGGTWRRIRVIEYTSKFCETPNANNPREFPLDLELNDKIERWADTFISMLIDRHSKLDPKDIVEPAEVRIATEGYKKNNDVIGQFLSEKLVRDDTATERVMLQNLYNDFKLWCSNVVPKGKKVPDRNQIKAYMEKLYGVYSVNNPGWKGVRYITVHTGRDADEAGANSDVE
jgi:P4 family phage/plasmid primase-like protien